ncbi:MAG: C39 family peptidase [Cyclobacteriaceae bacterium]
MTTTPLSQSFILAAAFSIFSSCQQQSNNSPGRVLIDLGAHQQSTDYTCGPAAVLTLMNHLGIEGNEMTIAKEMGTDSLHGTTPEEMTNWLNQNGFKASWHEEGSLEMLRNNLKMGKPTLVEWNDWGGHWVLVVGYDTKDTEVLADDEITFADPYDRYDGIPDGITTFNAERFYYMWYDALLFGRVMKRVYIEVTPL